MALIKCNECGQMISDKAMKCPKCGNPVGQVSNKKPMSSNNIITNETYTYENESTKSKWLYPVIGVLVVALLGLAAWLFIFNDDKQNQTEQIVDNTNVTNAETNNTDLTDNKKIDSSQSMDFSGKVGKYPVTMHLEFDNNNVNGYYYYNSGSSKLQLTGSINNNHIELNETTQEGRPTGHFNGEMIDGVYSGEFINYKGEHFNFTLANSPLSTEETRVNEEDEYEVDETNESSDPIVSSRTDKWTGASSESELRQKLNGTSWYINWKGLRHKFEFSDGAVTLYTSINEEFSNEGNYYDSYLVKSKGESIVIGFGNEEKYLDNYQIVFTDSRAFLGMHGKPIGELTFMGR